MCKGLKFRLGARVAKEVGNGCWAQHCLFKKSIWSSKLLFLFQLCDNFKGLEKSNKMVLMMHSKQSVFEKFQGNTFLGGQEMLAQATGPSCFWVFAFLLFWRAGNSVGMYSGLYPYPPLKWIPLFRQLPIVGPCNLFFFSFFFSFLFKLTYCKRLSEHDLCV